MPRITGRAKMNRSCRRSKPDERPYAQADGDERARRAFRHGPTVNPSSADPRASLPSRGCRTAVQAEPRTRRWNPSAPRSPP